MIITPVGVAGGPYVGYRLAGGLVFRMAAFIAFLCVAFAQVILVW